MTHWAHIQFCCSDYSVIFFSSWVNRVLLCATSLATLLAAAAEGKQGMGSVAKTSHHCCCGRAAVTARIMGLDRVGLRNKDEE